MYHCQSEGPANSTMTAAHGASRVAEASAGYRPRHDRAQIPAARRAVPDDARGLRAFLAEYPEQSDGALVLSV